MTGKMENLKQVTYTQKEIFDYRNAYVEVTISCHKQMPIRGILKERDPGTSKLDLFLYHQVDLTMSEYHLKPRIE